MPLGRVRPFLHIPSRPMDAVDPTSVLVIVGTAALAGLLVMAISPKLAIPVVVVELVLGIAIGPQGFDVAKLDDTTEFLGDLGLGMLFFFAGYEIDFKRIQGKPLKLGAAAWALSLVLAYGLGGILAALGVVVSYLYTGSAMATTAIGTLIPILRDAGEIRTRFGTFLLAGGAMGEFGPILLITLILSTTNPLHEALILIAFVAVAVFTGVLAVRSAWKGWPLIERTLETSSQLAVRLAVVLVFGLVALAAELGLDLLLGGFVAGMITRVALRDREVTVFDSKLTAVGYGLLIPFFFITSGMAFDLDALTASLGAVGKMFLFLVLFLVVRGVPALILYRSEMSLRDRSALALFYATELPLVVAITTLAVDGGHMHTSTAAGLVGAAILSSLIYPLVALKLRRDGREPEAQPA
jgi:Kef-type K+ transport system membrane component KefB